MEPAASERPLVSFRRAYSCIEGLQPAYTVRYELFLEKTGLGPCIRDFEKKHGPIPEDR